MINVYRMHSYSLVLKGHSYNFTQPHQSMVAHSRNINTVNQLEASELYMHEEI